MNILGPLKNSILLVLFCSCQTSLVPVKRRQLVGVNGPMKGFARPVKTPKKDGDLFIRKKDPKIVDRRLQYRSHGSLFSLERSDNFLFNAGSKFAIGAVLRVAVSKSQVDRKETADEVKKTAEIAMKIVGRNQRGDILLEARRTSANSREASYIRITSRLPVFILNKNEKIKTNDLTDISVIELEEHELTERNSLIWKDRYSKNWFSFAEARSHSNFMAGEESKRMSKMKENLKRDLKIVADERRKLSKERSKVRSDGKIFQTKVLGLEEKISEQEKVIEDQQQVIDSFNKDFSQDED